MSQTSLLKNRLPLYGPLEIQSAKAFFRDCKQRFVDNCNKPFPSTVSIKQFDILCTLGRGSFGSVKLIKMKSKEKYYAMKVIEKRRLVQMREVKHALNEKRMLQSVDFPFGVRMDFFSQDASFIYFVMPFISGGELYTYLRKFQSFDEYVSRFYAAQVVLALEYFQHIRFVHRDIKPENILVDHLGFIKLADYGFAKIVENRTYTFCGTPPYIAPETIQGIGYAASVDWWALGILIYEMNAGHPPFKGKDNITLFTKIMYDTLPIPFSFSEDLQNLVKKLLQRDVTRRFGILKNGAEDVKSHEWFKEIDWLRLLNRNIKPLIIPQKTKRGNTSNFPDSEQSSALHVRESDKFSDEFKDF